MNNLNKLTEKLKTFTEEKSFKLTEENIYFFDVEKKLCQCREENEIYNLASEINDNYIIGDKALRAYIDSKYKDFAVSDSALKNIIKYSYLRDNFTKSGTKKVYKKSSVDDIFSSNIVVLDSRDFFNAFNFSLNMLEKVENVSVRFGTFFDKLAKRNGSALNYIDRQMTGKLGEIGTVKHLNSILAKMNSKFQVESSLKTDQVEAADIVQLRDNRGVIVSARSQVQIKSSIGLNTVVLKEDKSKLEGETFRVDYCVFAQLLNGPLNFLIDIAQKMNNIYNITNDSHLNNFLQKIDLDDSLIKISVKLAGFTEIGNMTLIRKGQNLKPLGDVSTDSYYSYLADLNNDFSELAENLIP